MAEEHRCQQAPEGHRLCANNCGFFGSPATMNLCSKCFRQIQSNEQEQAKTKSTIQSALSSSAATTTTVESLLVTVDSIPQSQVLNSPKIEPSDSVSASVLSGSTGPVVVPVQSNRCATCRKRVGLTGFKCKCGVTFCGAHRYPEKHACGFDFKAMGREEIARANPVIKAEKLDKI
ncbi:hypothetical protein TanjilG_27660 [Lupinus angustifolius]|uniref:Uncharacterized protein n=1 Tax=Lupinus angustifolius TaxID=3871 RepID=A0A1J7FVQ0_LUPAN|nr:PREDICTED: zinc finger A20 and AN1 domain-containing stress-associated protein 4-like [Lupinus angustifolius]OIV92163.1 hypothetical protein TanjilG_27660 [Lupinus angustifolius]